MRNISYDLGNSCRNGDYGSFHWASHFKSGLFYRLYPALISKSQLSVEHISVVQVVDCIGYLWCLALMHQFI